MAYIIKKSAMQLRRLFKVQWPINKLITKSDGGYNKVRQAISLQSVMAGY